MVKEEDRLEDGRRILYYSFDDENSGEADEGGACELELATDTEASE
ncbi:MAG: hypothetical protein WCL39_14675 [Armatimonadota bacterium]